MNYFDESFVTDCYVDATEIGAFDSAADIENCLSEWAIGSDEMGNLILCESTLAENLRPACCY